ncbi:MAG: glycerol-3-phosphate 1-O-acyltransferase PlsY, partial [Alphaproteobacteria bacterium]|nr:glycerol-3-phosphate 1-O-acyltransferase PlsY [Alphaproteobacteria bacterium]
MSHAPIVILLAYFLGSIPFGLLLTRLAGYGDIRKIGSGNIGATNVLRTGNKKLAAAVLLLDALKGVAAVKIALAVDPNIGGIAALNAVVGHMFPFWLKFEGGKGVATSIGVITALNWPTGLLAMGVWLPIVFLLRISSLA